MTASVARTVAERIRELRARYDVSQDELARAVGKTRSSIASIETGSQKTTVDTLEAIARHFGVRMSALLGESDLPRLPRIEVHTICEVRCEEHGLLDDGLTREEAERQRDEHRRVHLSPAYAAAVARIADTEVAA